MHIIPLLTFQSDFWKRDNERLSRPILRDRDFEDFYTWKLVEGASLFGNSYVYHVTRRLLSLPWLSSTSKSLRSPRSQDPRPQSLDLCRVGLGSTPCELSNSESMEKGIYLLYGRLKRRSPLRTLLVYFTTDPFMGLLVLSKNSRHSSGSSPRQPPLVTWGPVLHGSHTGRLGPSPGPVINRSPCYVRVSPLSHPFLPEVLPLSTWDDGPSKGVSVVGGHDVRRVLKTGLVPLFSDCTISFFMLRLEAFGVLREEPQVCGGGPGDVRRKCFLKWWRSTSPDL